jgi:HAD superfamily hydrolase (TIGR01484 family)
LHDAGVRVVPVTGRPAGWCDLIARQWPVDGVVGENGALWFAHDGPTRPMARWYAKPAAQRAHDRAMLDAIRDAVLAEVPGAAVASDQFARAFDLAIDFREDVPALDADAVARIVAIFESHGATAKVSSIHVNGWIGDWDKRSAARHLCATRLGLDLDDPSVARRVVYVGDSPNDAPLFAAFPNAVGVANVLDFHGQLAAEPAWVTRGRGADGFVELVDALLAVRG